MDFARGVGQSTTKSLLCGTDGIIDYPRLLNIGELSMIDALSATRAQLPTLYKKIFIVLKTLSANHFKLRCGML